MKQSEMGKLFPDQKLNAQQLRTPKEAQTINRSKMAASTVTAMTMEDLPVEILDIIIRKLPTKDTISCSQLNRNFARLIKKGEYLFDDPEAFKKLVRANRADLLSEYLKRSDANASIDDNWAIQYASEHGHIKMAELLLAQDSRYRYVDPSARNDWAIRWASNNGHKEVVELLLARDSRYCCVDPSACDNFAIRKASYNGHKEVVGLLMARDDVDPSAGNNFAIKWASFFGREEVVKLLLADPRVQAKGIPQNILDKYGKV